MKLFFKLLLLLAPSFSGTCSQTNLKAKNVMKTDNETAQILEVTRKLTTLMIEKNTKEMDNILDAHFTLTHITVYVQPKGEWFAEIESERMKYNSYKEVKTLVEISENNASFIGQNLLDARIWGTRNTWRLQQTMQLKKGMGNGSSLSQ